MITSAPGNQTPSELKVPKAILEAEYSTVLYKAGVQIYDKYFSGIFFFREDSLDCYRIVFLNEFGLTLLDYSYIKGDFILNSCKEFLNKRMVLSQLRSDLGVLLRSFPEDLKLKEHKSSDEHISAIKFKFKPNKYFYFYSVPDGPEKVIIKKGFVKKTTLSLSNYQTGLPVNIEFVHKPVKIRLTLTKIKQE